MAGGVGLGPRAAAGSGEGGGPRARASLPSHCAIKFAIRELKKSKINIKYITNLENHRTEACLFSENEHVDPPVNDP